MLSDSQGSTAADEQHGFQKQLVGDGFVVGFAGSMMVIMGLMHHLSNAESVSAGDIQNQIQAYLEQEVRPAAVGSIEVLLLRQASTGIEVRTFYPQIFRSFGEATAFGTIGSGAPYAHRTLQRDMKLGVLPVLGNLADAVAKALELAEAADESLTVDDQLLIGLLVDGKSYMLGDGRIFPGYAPAELQSEWRTVVACFNEIRALAGALRAEAANAYRAFSQGLLQGPFEPKTWHMLRQSGDALGNTRAQLEQKLREYRTWYDGIMSRP